MFVAVIVNPISGTRGHRDGGARRAELARGVLEAEGLAGAVHLTQGPGDAFELTREMVSRGVSLVVAWGGDGTVNEVGAGLAFGEVPLGIVPAGSGNGLARELGLPRDPAQALRVALRGAERRIDAGELGGRWFVNAAGIGFDAHVAARFSARGPGRRGTLAYVATVARELMRYQPREYEIHVDGERLRSRALLVACANSRQYGSRAIIAPRACLDDGALDLVVVGARSPLAAAWTARRLFRGTLAGARAVLLRPFRRLEVVGDAPLGFHVDGEPALGGESLTARVHPGALRVRV